MSHSTPAVSGSSNLAGSPTGSPSRAAEITATAQQKMPTAYPSAPLLAASQPPAFDFAKKDDEAHQLLENHNKIEAQRVFNEIFEQAKSVTFPVYNTTIARCKIGMAKTYEPGSAERLNWVRKAIQEIDTIFSKSDVWNLSEKGVIQTYQILRGLLQDLERGIPRETEDSLHKGIKEKLEICKQKILLLSDFELYLAYAEQALREEDRSGACFWFREGFQLIKDKTEIPYRLARINCLFKLVTNETEPTGKIEKILWAKKEIFDLYDLREEFYKIKSKSDALDQLYTFLTQLSHLLPADFVENHAEIKKRIETCTSEYHTISSPSRAFDFLTRESSRVPPKEMPKSHDRHPKKVSEGSDGSGRFIRLFTLFVFAVLAISAVAFYRRSIAKIN